MSKQPSIFKQLIEFLPLSVFFVVFTMTKDLVFATYFLMGATAIMLALSFAIYRRIEKMPLIVSMFVFVFGGMTIIFDNPDFIKLKPTILNFILAMVFFGSQFVYKKKSILELLLGNQLNLPKEAYKLMNNLWIGYFLLTGTTNLLVWKLMSEEHWVFFRFWGMMSMTIAFSVVQVALLYKYLKQPS